MSQNRGPLQFLQYVLTKYVYVSANKSWFVSFYNSLDSIFNYRLWQRCALVWLGLSTKNIW